MTREEAIKYGTAWLKDEYLYAKDGAFIKMAIEALKQEDILDKIRAEVMNLTNGEKPERVWNVDVLQIIDKYRVGSEEV